MDKAANARRLRRTRTLELYGYGVVMFPNARVVTDPGGVSDDILAVLRSDGV